MNAMSLMAQVRESGSSSSAPWVLLLLVAVTVIAVGLAVFPLADALRRPTWQWRAAQRRKGVWILALLFLPFLGGLMYLAGVRGELVRIGGAADE
jgi:hypothetical protein